MSLLFRKEGILTTVQDLGRNGFRRFGINANGVMDKKAARLINILLNNFENESVLEMHFPAPEILFQENALFALGGADFGASLSGEKIENWKPHFAEKGSVLKFSEKISCNRAYLSVKGGFKIEKWLESASTNLTAEIGGFSGSKLRKNDELFLNQIEIGKKTRASFKISNSLIPSYSAFPKVRVIAGAEFELLTAVSDLSFSSRYFVVSQKSDRMGFSLDGEPLFLLDRKELVSSAVNFGTIQLLPDGQLIILMADHQTSGGYPRIANVIEADLPVAAQLGANDKISFQLISIKEAENILLRFEKDLNFLKTAIKLHSYFSEKTPNR